MSKEQLLQELADAYEQIIAAATQIWQRGCVGEATGWGPREIIAHIAGWEVITAVRIPGIVAGLPPFELADKAQENAMDDAINAALVTMAGNQSLEVICSILRRAYRRNIEFLRTLDDRFFQPGDYVYRSLQEIIDHCSEHRRQLVPAQV